MSSQADSAGSIPVIRSTELPLVRRPFPERSGSTAINCGSVVYGEHLEILRPAVERLPVSAILSLMRSATSQLPSSAMELRKVALPADERNNGPHRWLRPRRSPRRPQPSEAWVPYTSRTVALCQGWAGQGGDPSPDPRPGAAAACPSDSTGRGRPRADDSFTARLLMRDRFGIGFSPAHTGITSRLQRRPFPHRMSASQVSV
jgi:hypothetical protein